MSLRGRQKVRLLTCRRMMAKMKNRALGAFVGLAVGDAVGTTAEFMPRGSFPEITDMVGGGPFRLRAGEWTDDTSMAIALAESLIACGRIDQLDLMLRFAAWFRRGEYSHSGTCFDIGATTAAAICRFELTGNPVAGQTAPDTAGNGSIMRLAPLALFCATRPDFDLPSAARMQSETTHAAPEAIDACVGLATMLTAIIRGARADDAAAMGGEACVTKGASAAFGGFGRNRRMNTVKSTGYVIDTLDAELWAVSSTGDFRSAVLAAANLGDDADTVAAVAGQLAGALYGLNRIPDEWVSRLAWSDKIIGLAADLVMDKV